MSKTYVEKACLRCGWNGLGEKGKWVCPKCGFNPQIMFKN